MVIFEPCHLGEAILSIPFIRAARRTWEVTLACRPPVGEVMRTLIPDLAISALPDGWAQRALFVRQNLRLAPVDATVCVWPDVRVQSLMRLTGAGIRGGFPMTPANYYGAEELTRKSQLTAGALFGRGLNLLPGGPLLTHGCIRSNASQSHLGNWEQLALALGFQTDTVLPWIKVPSSELPLPLRPWLKKHGHRRIIALHAGGCLPEKRWPLSRFQQLLDGFFCDQGLPVVIIQAPGEPAPMPRGELQITIPTPHIQDLAAVLNKSHLLLCNDSFAGHLAAALGKKVISLFGSVDPKWFAPYKNERNTIKAEIYITRPALGENETFSQACLEAIGTNLVEQKLAAVLSSRASTK